MLRLSHNKRKEHSAFACSCISKRKHIQMAKLDRSIPDILQKKYHIDAEGILAKMINSLPDEEELDVPAIMELKNEISREFSQLHDGIDETLDIHFKSLQRYDNIRAELARVNSEYAKLHANERQRELGLMTNDDTVDNALKYLEEKMNDSQY